jgi:outer membrane protein assembly factor BamB
VVAFLVLGMLVASIPALAGDADWSQAGFDGAKSRHNGLEWRLRRSNVERLRLDWNRRIRPDVGFIYEYVSEPAIVRDGRVFATWAGSEAFSLLAAFDERSGRRLWHRRSEHWMEPIAASDSKLIIGTFPLSIRALDARTGELRWSRQASWPFATDRGVRHIVALERGVSHRRISSIAVADGTRVWSRRMNVRNGLYSSVIVSGGLIILPVGTERGPHLMALRLVDGSKAWSRRGRGVAAAAADGRVFVHRWSGREPPQDIIEALSVGRGELLWSFQGRFTTGGVAVGGGGRVFLNRSRCVSGCEGEGYGIHRGGVVALDAASGRVLWRRMGDERRGPTLWQAGALANGLLFVSRNEYGRPRLGALAASTGRLRWRMDVGARGSYPSIGAVANGAVFAGLRFGRDGGRIVRIALPAVRTSR